jgi:hypothetical protein
MYITIQVISGAFQVKRIGLGPATDRTSRTPYRLDGEGYIELGHAFSLLQPYTGMPIRRLRILKE